MKYRHDWSYFFNFIRISFQVLFQSSNDKVSNKNSFSLLGNFRITFFLISLFHLSLTRRSHQFFPLISLSRCSSICKSLLLKIIEKDKSSFVLFRLNHAIHAEQMFFPKYYRNRIIFLKQLWNCFFFYYSTKVVFSNVIKSFW